MGIEHPYAHQAAALGAIAHGDNVVIATATASGKSLCYQLPIADAVRRRPSARALWMFPTKALARDQAEVMRRRSAEHAADLGWGLRVATYDGDTPPEERRSARTRAHVLATNPDMLHRAILPQHERFSAFFAGLAYIVLDELHVYRGLFGSHVANVLRRLWRVCEVHGGRPQFIASSATIANAKELAETLCGRPFRLIDEDGSPRGERTFIVLNPKQVDEPAGVRADVLKVARRIANELRVRDVSSLTFCRTRKGVELLTRYLREDDQRSCAGDLGQPRELAEARIRGYRGGYLPGRRREVEAALRDGEARHVVCTNALELGIDVGGLDAVMLVGYPGTRAATFQRFGRAGRRQAPSLGILLLSSDPLDQCIAADLGFLFDRSVEHARIDPDNPEVLVPHLRAAAFELPFRAPEAFGSVGATEVEEVFDYLQTRGLVERDHDAGGGVVTYALGGRTPADAIDLRGPLEENFTVFACGEGEGDPGTLIGEVDFEDAPLYLHEGAIYAVEGRTHEVIELDWDARKAFVRGVTVDYYTEAMTRTHVRLLEPRDRGKVIAAGDVAWVRTVPGFKKLRFTSHENVGFGPIDLPDLELQTVGIHVAVPHAALVELDDPAKRAQLAMAMAHAMRFVAAMLLMCDARDLGVAIASGTPEAWGPAVHPGGRGSAAAFVAQEAPVVVLFDRMPGGAGLAMQLLRLEHEFAKRLVAFVSGCRCATGCPTCLGAHVRQGHVSEGGQVTKREVFAAFVRLQSDVMAHVGNDGPRAHPDATVDANSGVAPSDPRQPSTSWTRA